MLILQSLPSLDLLFLRVYDLIQLTEAVIDLVLDFKHLN